jgi:hypothetical protein
LISTDIDCCNVNKNNNDLFRSVLFSVRARVGAAVEALRYKPEGRGIGSPMVSLEFFIDVILSDRTMVRRSTELLAEISTRNISFG